MRALGLTAVAVVSARAPAGAGAVRFRSGARFTSARFAAIDPARLFAEGETPSGCDRHMIFDWGIGTQ